LSGSVEGVMGNHDSYSDFFEPDAIAIAKFAQIEGADIVMESTEA
jgi:hypothetical protein